MNKSYSTKRFFYKLLDDKYLDETGKIKEEYKFTINNPTFHIQNSKFIAKPEDKFETMLFLPEGEGRKGEGGLRTRGYFKFNYVTANSKSDSDSDGDTVWYIADFYGNPVIPAPSEIQKKIENYLNTVTLTSHSLQSLPLISIITVVYNGAKYLEETIQSVINQTYPNVEYIIIDGGSTDGTLDIIKKYEDYIDYWVSERDKGIYDAMNKGITLCQGELIGIINSDDWYEHNVFEKIIDEYNKSDKKTILHGYMNIIKDEKLYYVAKPNKNLRVFKKGMILNHPTVFVPIDIYKKLGLFSTEYKIASDWDFMLRCYKNNFNFLCMKIVISNFRLGGSSFIFDKHHANEKHLIRKNNAVYKIFDKYYIYDLIKINIFGNYLPVFSNIKQAFFSKLK